jgi:hypothetical protein
MKVRCLRTFISTEGQVEKHVWEEGGGGLRLSLCSLPSLTYDLKI